MLAKISLSLQSKHWDKTEVSFQVTERIFDYSSLMS